MGMCECGWPTIGTDRQCERCRQLAVLELEYRATDEEIKHAYRRLAKKRHPDTNPGDVERAKAETQEVNAAKLYLDKHPWADPPPPPVKPPRQKKDVPPRPPRPRQEPPGYEPPPYEPPPDPPPPIEEEGYGYDDPPPPKTKKRPSRSFQNHQGLAAVLLVVLVGVLAWVFISKLAFSPSVNQVTNESPTPELSEVLACAQIRGSCGCDGKAMFSPSQTVSVMVMAAAKFTGAVTLTLPQGGFTSHSLPTKWRKAGAQSCAVVHFKIPPSAGPGTAQVFVSYNGRRLSIPVAFTIESPVAGKASAETTPEPESPAGPDISAVEPELTGVADEIMPVLREWAEAIGRHNERVQASFYINQVPENEYTLAVGLNSPAFRIENIKIRVLTKYSAIVSLTKTVQSGSVKRSRPATLFFSHFSTGWKITNEHDD